MRSGTAVVEELIMRKIQHLAAELHVLCVVEEPAATRVASLAQALGKQELQQLQVMLDVTGHESLTDFLRTMVFHTSDPFATQPIPSRVNTRPTPHPKAKSELARTQVPSKQPGYMEPGIAVG